MLCSGSGGHQQVARQPHDDISPWMNDADSGGVWSQRFVETERDVFESHDCKAADKSRVSQTGTGRLQVVDVDAMSPRGLDVTLDGLDTSNIVTLGVLFVDHFNPEQPHA
jgi:hypothetical protein